MSESTHATEATVHAGGCLCGAVRYELRKTLTSVTYCHCSMCRRWHGHVGAFAAVDRDGFVITEPRGLAWYSSSPKVRRGFCRECGSCLFFDQSDLPKMAFCAGTVDAPTGLRSKAHIFVASKGDYYAIADDGLVRLEGDIP